LGERSARVAGGARMTHRFEWAYGLIVPVIMVVVTVWAAAREQRRKRDTIRINGRKEVRNF